MLIIRRYPEMRKGAAQGVKEKIGEGRMYSPNELVACFRNNEDRAEPPESIPRCTIPEVEKDIERYRRKLVLKSD